MKDENKNNESEAKKVLGEQTLGGVDVLDRKEWIDKMINKAISM